MVACVHVPVTLPQNGEPTKTILSAIIGTFLKDWSVIDPEALTARHGAGHTDAHCFVERPEMPHGASTREPSKVFIKFHKGGDPGVEAFKHLVPTKSAEAEFSRRFGQTGYGPRVIGFFQTVDGTRGRIDQLVAGRRLKSEDVEVEDTRADIAKAHAVLHALHETGLPGNSVDAYYEAVIGGLKKYRGMDKLKRLAREGGVVIDELVNYDFASRLAQVVARMRSIRAKEGWCVHDVQFGNVIVRDRPEETGSTIALIDFEFVFRNYRAFDIGGHWFQKMFTWDDEVNKIVNCRPFTDEEKRHFCQVYAEKWNEVTGDCDTAEQVFAEASLGYALALSFDIHFMLMAMDEDDNRDPLDALGLKKLFDEFVKQYAWLEVEIHG